MLMSQGSIILVEVHIEPIVLVTFFEFVLLNLWTNELVLRDIFQNLSEINVPVLLLQIYIFTVGVLRYYKLVIPCTFFSGHYK